MKSLQVLVRALTAGLPKGSHVTRYAMYRHLETYRGRLSGTRILSISGSDALCAVLGFEGASVTGASYPEASVLDLPFEDGAFDGVVSDQVLEHVEGDPQRAIDECFRVTRPGGFAVHATCFLNPIHAAPGDFWRFTPDALGLLAAPHGEVVETGGWGNPWIWPYIGAGLRFESIPHARWHPLHWLATHNHPEWPVSTWVVATKSGDRPPSPRPPAARAGTR